MFITKVIDPPPRMDNKQKWSIIKAQRDAKNPEKMEAKAIAKAEKEMEKARKIAEKEAVRDAKRIEKELEKARKAAEKAAMPPKKRGRPAKELTPAAPLQDMPNYDKLDMLRKFAEDVYASLGAGHLESIYHAAMAVELRLAGIIYESEQVMPVTHKGQYVGVVRADIVVEKKCVLEFKISGKLDDAKQQARQYMKLQNIQFGFVVMFPKTDAGVVQFVDARTVDTVELDM